MKLSRDVEDYGLLYFQSMFEDRWIRLVAIY